MLSRMDTGSEVGDLLGMVLAERRDPTPWVMLNMVTSIDGGTAVEGGSTVLSDDDDRALFHAIRAVPDFILVGAGTARAENYRPVSLSEAAVSARTEAGRPEQPRLVIVSGSLRLDPGARVFGDPANPVLILGQTGANAALVAPLEAVAEVRLLPSIDGAAIIGELHGVILSEGGPTLNGELATAGVINEVNWTVAPMIISGESKRMVAGPPMASTLEMRLERSLKGDRALFLRYLRA